MFKFTKLMTTTAAQMMVRKSRLEDTMARQWPGAFAEKTNSPFNLSIKVPKTTLFTINALNEDDTTSDSEAHVWTGMRRMIGGGRKCRSSWYPWLGVGGKDASTVFDFTRVMQTRAVSTEGRDQQVRAEVAEKYIQLLEKMGHNEKAWMDKWDAKETAQNERWNLFVSAQSERWNLFVSAQSDRWTSFVYFITCLFVSMFVGFACLYYSMLSEFGEVKQLISAKQ
ncbi:hypothetical protein niasHT_017556 [Heterodera trifolii]|uniref:Uncharacterized protein n=1 Tax=Heterodera trifolii TaxID=157864 RepID=A0ABD2L622_9BILA